MLTQLKRLAGRLPESVQFDLKRHHYARRIRNGTFAPVEPEAALLPEWVGKGDWVLDVGANVGTYALTLSELVGPSGRVICFEPVPSTFSLLAANVRRFRHGNVSLVNAAVSDRAGTAGMTLPLEHGHESLYYAHIGGDHPAVEVLCLPLDSWTLGDHPITLVKIDVEGHEASAIRGMIGLLTEHRPRLIVEGDSPEVASILQPLGYVGSHLSDSPNTVFSARDA